VPRRERSGLQNPVFFVKVESESLIKTGVDVVETDLIKKMEEYS